MEKAWRLLEEVQQKITGHAERENFTEVIRVPAKISKGERYQGLPFLVLDYPRIFEKNDVFAIRSMFWWGKYFSQTLHLSGKYKMQFAPRLIAMHTWLQENNYYISSGTEEWEHHFEPTNMLPVSTDFNESFADKALNAPFIKIGIRLPIESWEEMPEKLSANHAALLERLMF